MLHWHHHQMQLLWQWCHCCSCNYHYCQLIVTSFTKRFVITTGRLLPQVCCFFNKEVLIVVAIIIPACCAAWHYRHCSFSQLPYCSLCWCHCQVNSFSTNVITAGWLLCLLPWMKNIVSCRSHCSLYWCQRQGHCCFYNPQCCQLIVVCLIIRYWSLLPSQLASLLIAPLLPLMISPPELLLLFLLWQQIFCFRICHHRLLCWHESHPVEGFVRPSSPVH